MDATRFIEDVSESVLKLDLKKYLGKRVEVIILPLEEEFDQEIDKKWIDESEKRIKDYESGKTNSSDIRKFIKKLKSDLT